MKPIAFTMGDPCGIGPEICVKLFNDGLPRAAFVIGDVGIMRRAANALCLPVQIREIASPVECQMMSGFLDVLPVSNLTDDIVVDLPIGKIDARAGQASYDYVVKAIELANTGLIDAIVTAPIAKEALKAAGISYPGHTEILAAKSGTTDFAMMLANNEIRSILVTIHVSLAEAIKLVTRERVLKTIRLADEACRAYGIENPRIAVAGLNPHAGEGGMFGDEDISEIAPAIGDAKAEGIEASGPWPGDTVFMRARNGEFDIVVAMYHDQGLIPVKYLGIDHGVNVTVGLPFIRTSVDHGTAFDIAGTGKANHASLRYAFDQAVLLTQAKNTKSKSEIAMPEPKQLPDFIFMLTNNDRTIPDAIERLQDVLAAGVKHIGFKDIGLPFEQLVILADAIRVGGASVYLEVVSLDQESEQQSAIAAIKLGVDVLMGGTRPEIVLPIIRGTGIRYYPFPGTITGHPSVLSGTVKTIVESARHLASLDGVSGLDLLAYRFKGNVPKLIKEVVAAIAPKPLVVAGSIDSENRLDAVMNARVAGFTIGTAALDGVFPAASKAFPDQLVAIQNLLRKRRDF